ncbi:ChrR family anti-sigma-E factor [Hyphomicrobium sp.]|uniref:ChrR family anti-sigma-E factor n=1 Tax=Hyphomicrobium sp. TaxID=82 RepID=UPI0025B8E5A3|nr:ChrR family anti-sigma-E factor [Hyphomicrobium sp.]MCC7253917.1 cupin domain-containing protein [Hyphomicrobium sp.]
MTITHHPDISTLMCCSAGSQPEACAAVIASHLACCPQCRAEVRRMQKIGVALFDMLEPSAMSESAPIIAMRACEQDNPDAAEGARVPCLKACKGDVPAPLAALIGERLDDIPWRWISPGVWTFQVPLSKGCSGDLRLFKIAPGKALPEHEHEGSELTLILRGSYSDALGTYQPGDVADIDEGIAHGPVACPMKGCICLTATEGKIRFKNWLTRLLQPLFSR